MCGPAEPRPFLLGGFWLSQLFLEAWDHPHIYYKYFAARNLLFHRWVIVGEQHIFMCRRWFQTLLIVILYPLASKICLGWRDGRSGKCYQMSEKYISRKAEVRNKKGSHGKMWSSHVSLGHGLVLLFFEQLEWETSTPGLVLFSPSLHGHSWHPLFRLQFLPWCSGVAKRCCTQYRGCDSVPPPVWTSSVQISLIHD